MIPAEDNIRIRFFQAIDALKDKKAIRGLATFCREYKLDRVHLSKIKNQTQGHHTIEAVWIAYLANYGINIEWVILGKGQIFL